MVVERLTGRAAGVPGPAPRSQPPTPAEGKESPGRDVSSLAQLVPHGAHHCLAESCHVQYVGEGNACTVKPLSFGSGVLRGSSWLEHGCSTLHESIALLLHTEVASHPPRSRSFLLSVVRLLQPCLRGLRPVRVLTEAQYVLTAEVTERSGLMGLRGVLPSRPLLPGHGLCLLLQGHVSPCTSHWLPGDPGKDRPAQWLGEMWPEGLMEA